MIHCLGKSSDECKVLGECGTKYSVSHPTKDQGKNPIHKKGSQKKQDIRNIINNIVDELHMVKSQKVSAVNHDAPEFLESAYDANDLYQVENMSLVETKAKIELRKPALEYENSYVIENWDWLIHIHNN